MNYKYDLAVFIGRFQPFHNGHKHIIDTGLRHAKKVLVLAGSAGSPRSHRNPFLYDERSKMILDSYPIGSDGFGRVVTRPLEDVGYNDPKWATKVQEAVSAEGGGNVAVIGHKKDETCYYLDLFPQWGSIAVENFANLNGTTMRNAYFSNIGSMWVKDCDGHNPGDLPRDHIVTPVVREFLMEFRNTASYKMIKDEYEFILKYRASWAVAPYPVNLVCVDAVVIKSGHVLMIERGAFPGKGQMALPGGYLNVNERAVDGMIRELREETGLKVPDKVLRGSITAHDIFDDPNRSARGRVMTIAYLIDLGTGPLDKVKGSDDAVKAKWIPLSNVRRSETFEDHIDIIEFLVGV
jgi:bifunctional NMN adenylyltransferase/nudix hydrolase